MERTLLYFTTFALVQIVEFLFFLVVGFFALSDDLPSADAILAVFLLNTTVLGAINFWYMMGLMDDSAGKKVLNGWRFWLVLTSCGFGMLSFILLTMFGMPIPD